MLGSGEEPGPEFYCMRGAGIRAFHKTVMNQFMKEQYFALIIGRNNSIL